MAFTCDIILLSYESPELLKKCVESVLDCTRTPSRLIIVDNASEDPEVGRYLQDVRGRSNVEVMKVFNGTNRGFAGGMNTGLRLAEAPYVCLLNNDCVVTDGWLEEMIKVADKRPEIGLVCPQSNTFGSGPAEGGSLEEHASGLARRSGDYTELGHAIFFACLIKKEVMDKIGLLDEVYEGVCYEDTDYSLRAGGAGYIAALAEGAYVYHKMQASRKKMKNREEVYARNRRIFEKKWDRLYRSFCLETVSLSPAAGESYELLKGLARKRVFVDLWLEGRPQPLSMTEALGGAVRHSDITVKGLKGPFARGKVLWKILTKKKRYDAVFLPRGLLFWAVSVLGFAHGAEPFMREGRTVTHGPSGMVFDLADSQRLVEFIKDRRK